MGKKLFHIAVFLSAAILFISGVFFGEKESEKTKELITECFSLSFSAGTVRHFKSDDFLLNLNLHGSGASVLNFITLPKGELSFKGEKITSEQSVSFSELSSLSYYSDFSENDFFEVNIGNISALVSMIPCDEKNLSPTGSNISFATAADIAICDSFPVFDSDGDPIEIKITSKPKKGLLSLNGTSFTYTPFPKGTGIDSFRFVAIDKYGNYSKEYTASITIETVSSAHYYTDTASCSGAFAAVKLSEKGIFSGEKIGNIRVFRPEKEVETGEFLMLLNEVAEIFDPPAVCFDTGLSSNAETEDYLKPYIKTAVETGLISDYSPYTALTKETAYFYAAKMLGLQKSGATSVIFPSISSVNPDYLPAYLRLLEAGYITFEDTSEPKSAFTRNDLARLLYNISES